ncbi:MAG: hypothetical protein KDJ52_04855 [Anaerolineae bacterium]|nr:hypothetical protein [Anaerolineae bacterium]
MNIADIVKYWQIIRKWWWVILLLFVTTVGTILGLAFFSEPEYQAVVKVQVNAPPPQEVPLYSDFGRQVISAGIEQAQNNFSELLREGDALRSALENNPDVSMSKDELLERVTVEVPEGSLIMRIQVLAPDPDDAAALANAIVDAGLHQYEELLAQSTVSTLKFIDQQIEITSAELSQAETTLMQFQIENKVGQLDQAINSQYNFISDLRKQSDLASANGDLDKAHSIQDIILDREIEMQNMISLSAEYNRLQAQVSRVRETYNFLLDRKTEAQIKESQIRSSSSIQIITPARPPQRPTTLLDGRIVVLGGVVSLLAGVLLAFLLEYLSTLGASQKSPYDRLQKSETFAMSDSSS